MGKNGRKPQFNPTVAQANAGVWIAVGFVLGGLFGFGAISGDALAVKNVFGGRDTIVFFGCPIIGICFAWLISSARSHKKRESRDPEGCSVGCLLMPALACFALAAGNAIPVIVLAIDIAREGQSIEGAVTDFRTKVFDEGDYTVAVIQYRALGRVRELERSGEYALGDHVRLTYLRSRPDIATTEPRSWLQGYWIYPGLAGSFLAIFPMLLWLARRARLSLAEG